MRKNKLKHEPSCSYCAHGRACAVEGEILCEKKGIRLADSSCKKFIYDPLKREPKKAPVLPKYDSKEFALEETQS
ncbi:MAG: hypothetical protein LBS36_12570 [Oscillospiraceae bacterium]|jgi:hypothetical protein|nr:hypothetical protein [Oscillospiraceae bacterium]